MVEFLYDAVHAIRGEAIDIAAEITDADGNYIESVCSLIVLNDYKQLYNADGVYANGTWTFTIPADVSAQMQGNCWYRVMYGDSSLSFAAPIYLEE